MATTIRHLKKRLSRELFLLAKRTFQAVRGQSTHKRTVFVAGAQRSGTNMMMNILEKSLQTDAYHETDPRAFVAYEMRPVEEIHELVRRSCGEVVAVKSLCEIQDLRKLLDEFVPAKALWMVRDYEDVVNSHVVKWTGMPDSIAKIVEDRDGAGWRGRGMSDKTHELVKSIHHAGLSNASACALFWYVRNVLYFEQELDTDERVLLVRYEPLVQRPATEIRRVFEFLGLPLCPRIYADIFASSVGKQEPPEIEPRVRELCDELTTRFHRDVEPVPDPVGV